MMIKDFSISEISEQACWAYYLNRKKKPTLLEEFQNFESISSGAPFQKIFRRWKELIEDRNDLIMKLRPGRQPDAEYIKYYDKVVVIDMELADLRKELF